MMIGTLILLILAIVLVCILWKFVKNVVHLVINSIFGLVILYLVNFLHLFSLLSLDPVPINLISIIVCALAGIPGAILLIILHIIGLY